MSLRTAELSKEKSLASYNEPIISTPILVQGTAFSDRFYLKSTKNTGCKKKQQLATEVHDSTKFLFNHISTEVKIKDNFNNKNCVLIAVYNVHS